MEEDAVLSKRVEVAMSTLFPTQGVLRDVFAAQTPLSMSIAKRSKAQQRQTRSSLHDPFSVWSAVDDAKTKAGALSEEAQKEIAKASTAARAKTGDIELYSLKYYSACTFGGLIACVSSPVSTASVTAAYLLYLRVSRIPLSRLWI